MRRLMLPVLLLPGIAAGQALDATDARLREQAYLRAWSAPLGKATIWRDPASGDNGQITPVREHQPAGGEAPCRDMAETLTVAGVTRAGTATGCRDADQSWHVVAGPPGDADDTDPASVPADLPPYQAPADISADPRLAGQAMPPGIFVRVRPAGRETMRGTAAPAGTPEIFLSVPPAPASAPNESPPN